VNVYNNGIAPVTVYENATFPNSKITVAPGSMVHYVSERVSTGTSVAQLDFGVNNAADNIDILVSDPVLKKNGVSLNPNADFNTGWAGFSGSVGTITPAVAGPKNYLPWIKQAGPIRRSRDSRTDAADIILQNLSGNTIDRDLLTTLKNHEMEVRFACCADGTRCLILPSNVLTVTLRIRTETRNSLCSVLRSCLMASSLK
jgi:hypothetical protein